VVVDPSSDMIVLHPAIMEVILQILLVEDDENLGEMIAYNLEKQGYRVDWVLDGDEAIDRIKRNAYDMIVLDIMLPKRNGFEVCRFTRSSEKNGETPIILLTALPDEENKIQGFNLGADDYVTKPFSMKELIARIEVISKRVGITARTHLKFDGIELDRRSRSVTVNGSPVSLTKTEEELLEVFLESPEKVFSKEQLLERIWKGNVGKQTRTVDVYISRLRKKLGKSGKYLKTLPRIGYKLTREV
jgi:DNA-binding response OmpR family regulator